jgi:DNA-binding NtrC family response regulator
MYGPSSTVLVVDDDDDVRALAVAILHDAGFRAIPATNGDAALTMLQNGLVVDLLFTDIVMPGGLDGFSLAYEARQVQPDIQVLYTTGFTSLPKEVMKRVPGRMLPKPYRPGVLASAVMETLSEPYYHADRPAPPA